MSNIDKQKIREMRESGLQFNEISEELGISLNSIKSYCRRENVQQGERTVCKQCGKPVNQNINKRKKEFCCPRCRLKYWRAKKHDN